MVVPDSCRCNLQRHDPRLALPGELVRHSLQGERPNVSVVDQVPARVTGKVRTKLALHVCLAVAKSTGRN